MGTSPQLKWVTRSGLAPFPGCQGTCDICYTCFSALYIYSWNYVWNVGFLFVHQYYFTVFIGCFVLLWLKWAMVNQLCQPNSFSSNNFALLVMIQTHYSFFTFYSVTFVSYLLQCYICIFSFLNNCLVSY